MYGTIATFPARPEIRPKLESALADWEREVRPGAEGARNTFLFWPDNDRGSGRLVAIFDDEAAYRRNADRAEQDAWYQRFREAIGADPEWTDGQFVPPGG